MSDVENLNLPIPRLEIRYSPFEDQMTALYSLVYEFFDGDIRQIPLGLTLCSGERCKSLDYLDTPFREGAHIMHDMWSMRLPGYVINGTKTRALCLDKHDIPGGLATKLRRVGP